MNIFQHPPKERAMALLVECELPTSDLAELDFEYFLGCGNEEKPNGVIGLELHGKDALLRSLAVTAESRKQGCGKALVSKLEEFANSKGVKNLYLLTETAEQYFAQLGYTTVERNSVCESIRSTKEFSSLCPGDAAVMRKSLES